MSSLHGSCGTLCQLYLLVKATCTIDTVCVFYTLCPQFKRVKPCFMLPKAQRKLINRRLLRNFKFSAKAYRKGSHVTDSIERVDIDSI